MTSLSYCLFHSLTLDDLFPIISLCRTHVVQILFYPTLARFFPSDVCLHAGNVPYSDIVNSVLSGYGNVMCTAPTKYSPESG